MRAHKREGGREGGRDRIVSCLITLCTHEGDSEKEYCGWHSKKGGRGGDAHGNVVNQHPEKCVVTSTDTLTKKHTYTQTSTHIHLGAGARRGLGTAAERSGSV
jgi:hypothetical protein